MDEIAVYLDTAQQHGYQQQSARAALAQVAAWLNQRHPRHYQQHTDPGYYIYRSGSRAADTDEAAATPARSRILLAFASPDAALVFAQCATDSVAPRLLRLSLPRLLAALIQRPAIATLIFVDDCTDHRTTRGLPDGFRLERGTLLELLK